MKGGVDMLFSVSKIERIGEINGLQKSWLTLVDKDGRVYEKVGFVGNIDVGDYLNGEIADVNQDGKSYKVFKQKKEEPLQHVAVNQKEKSGYEIKDEKIARQGFLNQMIQLLPSLNYDLVMWVALVKKLEPLYMKYVLRGQLDIEDILIGGDRNEK
jgi:hypothetical protein